MPRPPRPTVPTVPLFSPPPDPHSLEARTVQRLAAWTVSDDLVDVATAWVACARMIDQCTRTGNGSAAPKLLERWEALRERLIPVAGATDADSSDPILAAIANVVTPADLFASVRDTPAT